MSCSPIYFFRWLQLTVLELHCKLFPIWIPQFNKNFRNSSQNIYIGCCYCVMWNRSCASAPASVPVKLASFPRALAWPVLSADSSGSSHALLRCAGFAGGRVTLHPSGKDYYPTPPLYPSKNNDINSLWILFVQVMETNEWFLQKLRVKSEMLTARV